MSSDSKPALGKFGKGVVILLIAFFIFILAFFVKQEKTKNSQSLPVNTGSYLYLNQARFSTETSFFDVALPEGRFFSQSAPPFLVFGKPLASLSGISSEMEIKRYVVQKGDTLSSIAKKFAISLETVLWANNLSRDSIITPGQELIILPVSGVLHIVKEGDTLSGIAKIYKAKIEDIVEANGLQDPGNIFVGDVLIVPGGKKPKTFLKYHQVPLADNYFICPIPSPCRVTQGLHWFNAVDLSNGKCGDPVFAAAGGMVQKTGYSRVGGKYVRIIHPNKVVTYYGHLSKITVKAGEKVFQGQVIGYVGHTGLTVPAGPAGCHVHFDVRFAKNPFRDYKRGDKIVR